MFGLQNLMIRYTQTPNEVERANEREKESDFIEITVK